MSQSTQMALFALVLFPGNHPWLLSDSFKTNLKISTMNIKRIFGALLTVLGIAGLIYAAVLFASKATGTTSIRSLIIYGILGLIFFISGISLVRTTKDES